MSSKKSNRKRSYDSDNQGNFEKKETSFEQAFNSFNERIPDETRARRELFEAFREIDRIACPYCNSKNAELQKREKICADCGRASSFTAGTFFHGLNLIRPVLGYITLLEEGVRTNPHEFAEKFAISYDTAWHTFQRLATVADERSPRMAEQTLSENFQAIITRRTRETPARAHPREEEHFMQVAAEMRADNAPSAQKSSMQSTLLSKEEDFLLSLFQGKALHFDYLLFKTGLPVEDLYAAITELELAGLIKTLPGNVFAKTGSRGRFERELSEEVLGVIGRIIHFIRRVSQGVSRKYLGKHIAGYCAATHPTVWNRGALLGACLTFRYVSREEILSYVSPLAVHLPALT